MAIFADSGVKEDYYRLDNAMVLKEIIALG
jgi:hypothetical protein